MNEEKVSQFLGWFSIGLGLVEVLAPEKVGETLGLEEKTGLIRAFGFREIASGAGILMQNRRAPWLWARVGGDALDSALLSMALSPNNKKQRNAIIAVAVIAPIVALDIWCARALSEREN